jgi:hypothetical protein
MPIATSIVVVIVGCTVLALVTLKLTTLSTHRPKAQVQLVARSILVKIAKPTVQALVEAETNPPPIGYPQPMGIQELHGVKESSSYTKDNRPVVIFVCVEYDPYCSAEQWPLTIALSYFGNFKRLAYTSSSKQIVFGGTVGPSFYGTSYKSQYIVFKGVEEESNQLLANRQYLPLAQITPMESLLMKRLDIPPGLSKGEAASVNFVPFLDIANRYILTGSTFSPSLLHDLSFSQISQEVVDPTTPLGYAILIGAARIVNAICSLTNEKPADVCYAAQVDG